MIKLIIFDLDGVLVESRDMHYESLNKALIKTYPQCVISKKLHLSTFDGLSTTTKLNMLSKKFGLPKELHNEIWKLKQKETHSIISKTYTYDYRIRDIMKKLKKDGYTIYVASNSIYKTVQLILRLKGFLDFVDYFISNEDVVNKKPHPEIYFKCMIRANVSCDETVVIEDSHIGRKAALSAGTQLLCIENPDELLYKKITSFIETKNKEVISPKWKGECNIVIPIAGNGSRFVNDGYVFPKPLIDVKGKPMIQVVVENLGFDPNKSKFIFICKKEHLKKFNLEHILRLLVPNCEIVITEKVTEGAACSILLAEKFIDNDKHLLLANSDQYMEWNPNLFMYSMIEDSIDGGIATFENTHPKWSYAKLDEDGFVCQVAEKNPISNHATTGIYYWKKGSDFVKYSKQMINKNIRVNNEFYTAPVFNEAILDNKKIKIFPVQKMWGLGTPFDLQKYLNYF